jgi:hypothetical protein
MHNAYDLKLICSQNIFISNMHVKLGIQNTKF